MLLGKLWDKIDAGTRKNILASTCFLSPRELELSRYLFGTPEGLLEFGGYEIKFRVDSQTLTVTDIIKKDS